MPRRCEVMSFSTTPTDLSATTTSTAITGSIIAARQSSLDTAIPTASATAKRSASGVLVSHSCSSASSSVTRTPLSP